MLLTEKLIGQFKTDSDPFSQENCEKVCTLYALHVYRFFGKVIDFRAPTPEEVNETKKRKKRGRRLLTAEAKKKRAKLRKIKKFIQICQDLDVPFETYMQVQFRILKSIFAQTAPHSYPSFGYLISENAVERFEQCASAEEKSISLSGEQKQVIEKRSDLEQILRSSLTVLSRRLERVREAVGGELSSELALAEVERLTSLKYLSRIYIYSSDFIREHGSEHLKQIQEEVAHTLSDEEKERVLELRQTLLPSVKKEIRAYV